MTIEQIQKLGPMHGTAVVPAVTDYDASSAHWRETEFRAQTEKGAIIGFWRGEPGWVRIDSWPYREVCVILEGAVALEDEHGKRRTFGPGEAFTVPSGFKGFWHTLEPTQKVFVGIG